MKTLAQPPIRPAADLAVEIHHSIDEIDPAEWDAVTTPDDLQARHRFIKVCQDAGTGDAVLRHVLIRERGRPVCAATLSLMQVKIDLLAGPRLRAAVRLARRSRPRFMEMPVLFAGPPVSFGQSSLRFDPRAPLPRVLPALAAIIDSVAVETGAELIVAKEFTPLEMVNLDGLRRLGYLPAASLPGCALPIRWPTFERYVAAMRAGYRRQVLATIRQRRRNGLEVRTCIGMEGRCTMVHRLYEQVMDRAEFKLERLDLRFFETLAAAYGPDLRCLVIEKEGQPLAAGVMLMGPGVAQFLVAGIDYRHNRREGAYVNLVTEVVREAVAARVRYVELGQTSYELKQRLGAVTVPRHMFLRHRHRRWHRFLATAGSRLFPERAPPARHVFGDGLAASERRGP